MNFFKVIILTFISLLLASNVFGDNHDTTEKELLEKAKEINQKVKLDQADKAKATPEEPLPLNDPFAGDDATQSTIVSEASTESDAVNLRRYKLVAAFAGSLNEYATFVNETGEFITLELQEELTEGLKLVEINIKEAVFQKSDNGYISLNFKNQIRERDEF